MDSFRRDLTVVLKFQIAVGDRLFDRVHQAEHIAAAVQARQNHPIQVVDIDDVMPKVGQVSAGSRLKARQRAANRSMTHFRDKSGRESMKFYKLSGIASQQGLRQLPWVYLQRRQPRARLGDERLESQRLGPNRMQGPQGALQDRVIGAKLYLLRQAK